MNDLTFKATADSQSATRVEVSTRHFKIVIDEPPELGGEDRGPNPVEIVLAGLIGCLNVVTHLIARERNIPIRSLRFEAEGELNPQKLLGQPTEDRPGYKRIGIRLIIDSDATDDSIAELIRVVETRCPVSDNLGNSTPLHIETRRPAA